MIKFFKKWYYRIIYYNPYYIYTRCKNKEAYYENMLRIADGTDGIGERGDL